MDIEKPPRRHIPGEMESQKFESRREPYYKYVNELKGMGYSFEDFLHYFSAFVGDMTLSRVLALYESYKSTLGVSGHIADVGMFKGASSLLFAKLVQIFEPNSLTQVHGFDWFKGNIPGDGDKREHIVTGGGKESYERLTKLIRLQQLDHVIKVHNVDLIAEIESFFQTFEHLRFKLIFMDAGSYKVVKSALPHFWERLSVGGRIIFDQYNFDVAPGETRAVTEHFDTIGARVKIRTYPFTWMPTAYIDKE
jgi:hypothetical protein